MWKQIGRDLDQDLKGTRKLIYSMSKGYKNRFDDKPKNTSLKDKDGVMITGEERVSSRWIEYFEDLLNVNSDVPEEDNINTGTENAAQQQNENALCSIIL